MLFNLKSAFVLGLATFASAAPVALTEVDAEVATLHHLEARAALPEHGVKCGTQVFTKAQIQAAVSASRTQRGKYPELFKNHNKVFSNHPSPATNLWEYPMGVPAWTGMYYVARGTFLSLYHRR
jgi:CHAD domain-containing protein